MESNYRNKINIDFLLQTQWYSPEKIAELRLEGLKQLVNHAKNHTVYYQNVPEIESLDDLSKIPILTKKNIKENFSALTANNIKGSRGWTGGTSEQMEFLKDADIQPFIPCEQRFHTWYPISLQTRPATIWGAGELGFTEPRTIGKRLYLPIESMVDEISTLTYLNLINKHEADSIRGYASALVALSYYKLKHDLEIPTVKIIVNNCEPFPAQIRKIVEDAFHVPVFNFYGSQDLGSMGGDCEKHEGLHLCAERYILEIMDDGRLIWTDLLNYAMPLIRYENGDVGSLQNKPCSCGRGLPLLGDIVGRTLNYLWQKNGTWLNSTEINEHMYYDIPNFLSLVTAHQIQQDEQGKIVIRLKVWDEDKLPNMQIITDYFKDNLDITVQYVDTMVRSRSGKQLACITKFRPPWVDKNNFDESQGIESRGERSQ